MKYYIIAGEASGDLHGSNLIREIRKRDSQAFIRCWGGDKMKEAGGELVMHYRDLAFMGFTEVIMNLRTILRNLRFCKEDILQYKPDALILIDYPGFNLRIAKWARDDKIMAATHAKTIFYISPQVWAWKESRVPMMKKYIDKMLVILPFEQRYFNDKWHWQVEYVGHPLVNVIDRYRQEHTPDIHFERPVIALLPGSRKQEIIKKLPIMLRVCKHFPDYHFVVAQAPAIDDEFYTAITAAYPNVSIARNKTYDLLLQAKAALVTSGTATLETALFGVPEVVCYKGSPISYEIAKRVIKVKYISLVNLIMDRLVVKELIQHELTEKNLVEELNDLLNNENRKATLEKDYHDLRSLLGQGGNASARAAESIVRFLTAAT